MVSGPFESGRDKVCSLTAIVLIILALLSYFNIVLPGFVVWIIAALFVIGGLFGIFNAFEVDAIPMRVGYILLFIIVILMGINGIYLIPFVSNVFALLPIDLTNYIINVIVAILLFIVAMQSD